jgi:hypothetical protein
LLRFQHRFTIGSARVGASISGVLFIVAGLTYVLPGSQSDLGGRVIGTVAIIIGMALPCHGFVDARLTVSNDGVTYFRYLRPRRLPWADIVSFDAGQSRSMLHWPCVVITTTHGRVRVDAMAGRRAAIDGIVDELRELQRARLSDADHGSGSIL